MGGVLFSGGDAMTCTGCIYWRRMPGNGPKAPGTHSCHYALDCWPRTRAHDGHIEKPEEGAHKMTKEGRAKK